MTALVRFSDRLSQTQVSQTIQNSSWIVPGTQTIHILALATVLFTMLVFDLQIMGVLARPVTPNWMRLPMRWFWGGLVVLALSGMVLIWGEPKRELLSWPFRIKMALVALVSLLTWVLSRVGHRPPRSMLLRSLGGVALVCWVLIVVCGRWIAYINFGPEADL